MVPHGLAARVSPRALQVYVAIGEHADFRTGDNAWPLQDTLARLLGCSVDAVQRATRELVDAGEVEVKKWKDPQSGRWRNRYALRRTDAVSRGSGRTDAVSRSRTDAVPSHRTDAAYTESPGPRALDREPNPPGGVPDPRAVAYAERIGRDDVDLTFKDTAEVLLELDARDIDPMLVARFLEPRRDSDQVPEAVSRYRLRKILEDPAKNLASTLSAAEEYAGMAELARRRAAQGDIDLQRSSS